MSHHSKPGKAQWTQLDSNRKRVLPAPWRPAANKKTVVSHDEGLQHPSNGGQALPKGGLVLQKSKPPRVFRAVFGETIEDVTPSNPRTVDGKPSSSWLHTILRAVIK